MRAVIQDRSSCLHPRPGWRGPAGEIFGTCMCVGRSCAGAAGGPARVPAFRGVQGALGTRAPAIVSAAVPPSVHGFVSLQAVESCLPTGAGARTARWLVRAPLPPVASRWRRVCVPRPPTRGVVGLSGLQPWARAVGCGGTVQSLLVGAGALADWVLFPLPPVAPWQSHARMPRPPWPRWGPPQRPGVGLQTGPPNPPACRPCHPPGV